MAKHTRPFVCTEEACTVKPFGDRAGLLRHCREVHGRRGQDKLSQGHRCPNLICKRHRRGFARRSNMIEHCRRIHEMNVDKEIESPEHRSPNISADLVGIESLTDDAEDTEQQIIYDYNQGDGDNNAAAARGLQSRLDEIQTQKEDAMRDLDSQKNTAMQRFDRDITTLSDALRVLKECATGNEQQG